MRPDVAQAVTVNVTGCGFVSTRENEIFITMYISISSLWCREKVPRSVSPINAMPLKYGKWATEYFNNRFPLSTCCVRDTA